MRQFALKASRDGLLLCDVPKTVPNQDRPSWRDWSEVPEPLYPTAKAAGQAAKKMGADRAFAYLYEPGALENGFVWCDWFKDELDGLS